MGQKGSTEQRRIKNILSNHAGLQVQSVQYPYEFFRRRLDYAINIVFTRKGARGGAPMSMARLCFLQVLIYSPRDFSPVLRFISPLKKQHSTFQVRSD